MTTPQDELNELRNQIIENQKLNRQSFASVYLSNSFNPCPCGFVYGPNDIEDLKKHHEQGHYNLEEKFDPGLGGKPKIGC